MVHHIGPHEFHTTGDITFLRAHGEFSLQDAEEYVRRRNQILKEQHYVLLLIDLTHTTGIPPEARRYIAASKIESDAQNHAIAVFGARPLTRALLQLLFSAVSLIGRRPMVQLVFAASGPSATTLDLRARSQFSSMACIVHGQVSV